MKRTLLIGALIAAAGGLAWELVPVQVRISDGDYELAVHVSVEGQQPRRVICEAYGKREAAEEVAAGEYYPDLGRYSGKSEPFDGGPLVVRVPTSNRESPLGREIRRFQYQYLDVIAEWPGGRRVGKVVDIPDGRASREVSVSFP